MSPYPVSPAGPVEVFLFKIFLATQFANLLIYVEGATILQASNANAHLVSLVLQAPH